MSFTLYSYHEYTFDQQRVNQMDIGRPGIGVVDLLAWFSMIEELKSVFTEFLEHNWTIAGDRINLAMVEFLSNPVSCLYHLFWAKVLEVFLHETFPPVKKATNFLVLGVMYKT